MRRFEFVEGSSSKFWAPELQGSTFIVTYGRIGTAGQRKEKAFPDEESARREYERKVAEKLREGYKEVSAEGTAAPAPASAPDEEGPTAQARAATPVGWQQRWTQLKPHVEAHLQEKGATLATLLESLDMGGDAHLAQRATRMGG